MPATCTRASVVQRELHYRICERFIYVAADALDRVVKVGMSASPERRMDALVLGKACFYPSVAPGRRLRVRLVRTWSLGVGTRADAISVEQQLHSVLRPLSAGHLGEWYRLATSRAVDVVAEFFAMRRSA